MNKSTENTSEMMRVYLIELSYMEAYWAHAMPYPKLKRGLFLGPKEQWIYLIQF